MQLSRFPKIAELTAEDLGHFRWGFAMNSQSLFVLIIVGLAILWTPDRVKADGSPTKEAGLQWGETVNGFRAHIEIPAESATRLYHPGEPFEFYADVQDASGNSVLLTYNEVETHTSLYVRIPDGRVFVRPSTNYLPRLEQIPAKGSKFVCVLQGRLNDRLKGWLDAQTLKPDAAVSLRQPGRYAFWFKYSGNPPVRPGTLESNRITLTVTDLPPAQRLQNPTAAQLDQLRIYLGPSNAKNPNPGRTEMVNAINRTENEGLAVYLVRQLDQNPTKGEQIFYLLRRRAAGIDGPYLHQFAEWCIGVLEHGTVDQASFRGFEGSLTEAPLEYLHFHPDDAKLRDRIVAIAEQCVNIPRRSHTGKIQEGVQKNEPLKSRVPEFLGLGSAVEVLFDQKVLRDGMGIDEAVAILGRPVEQDSAHITWLLPSNAVRIPRISADVKDGKISHFH